jgi:integral membrane protein (TIGR00529 family)
LKGYLWFSKVHAQRKFIGLVFVEPATALVVSFCFLGVMIYKRVNLGITLNATALLLALLSLDWQRIPAIIYETSVDLGTISVVFAAFGIMVMSQLYKETGVINSLSESLSRIIKNPKLLVSLPPAIIGLLPVAGGALMSAPLVEAETDKLGLKAEKKTYVNVWFRHTIFPVYPVSQTLILTAALTGLTVTSIIIRQIPIVISMVIAGYFISLWKTTSATDKRENLRANLGSELKRFTITFSPILATIIAVVGLGVDVSIAAFSGVAVLLIIARPSLDIFKKPFRNQTTYTIAFAAYGAFFLRSVVEATRISEILGAFVASGHIDNLLLLIAIPAVLAFFVGSPLAGVAISFSILDGIVSFTVKNAALLYTSNYLGYIIAPTHLCLVLTADYFKCSLGKIYRYFIPSLAISFTTAILLYILV